MNEHVEAWEKASGQIAEMVKALRLEIHEDVVADVAARVGRARLAGDALAARVAVLEEALTAIAKAGTKFDARGTHSAWVVDTARAALRASVETPTTKGDRA